MIIKNKFHPFKCFADVSAASFEFGFLLLYIYIYILLGVFVCSIGLWARQNTAQLVKILSIVTHQNVQQVVYYTTAIFLSANPFCSFLTRR